MKNKLSTEKMVELEKYLFQNYPTKQTIEEMKSQFAQKFNAEEISYLINAYQLPLVELNARMEYSRKNKSKDELQNLMEEYAVSKEILVKRLQQIRQIMAYLKRTSTHIFNPTFTPCNKLVRDYIPDKIKQDRNIPLIKTLDAKEYWTYLLKKDAEELEEVKNATTKEEIKQELADKLEVLKAMARFHNFTLGEIMDAADEKQENNGQFMKRILLRGILK